ncbi:hypothetical protein ACHAXT_002490 [Thalassiosira profunda]
MASASPRPRGPLAHVVDALRLDNRQLLLEALRRDPRAGGSPDRHAGADSAAGDVHRHGAPAIDGGAAAPHRSPVEQRLVFGSADLRRVMLRQVMRDRNHGKKDKKGKKKNLNQNQEEDEILREWNDELSSANAASLFGGRDTQIVGTDVLSPLGDGSLVSPYDGAPKPAGGMYTNNPFGDDDSSAGSSAPITTYVLRGGGFDLPSLAAATRHRRRALAESSQSNRFQHLSGGAQQQSSPEKAFRFLFVPRMTELERAFLKELGVEDDAEHLHGSSAAVGSMNSLESLPIDLVPLDDDVLSLELTGGNAFPASSSPTSESDKSGGSAIPPPASAASMRHSDIEGCTADVADIVARSLMKLQLLNRGSSDGQIGNGGNEQSSLKGAIGRVQGLGPLATAVIDRMMTLRLEEEREEAQADEEGDDDAAELEDMMHDEVVNDADGVEITASNGGQMEDVPGPARPPIQALLVIDRKIDLVTPLLTPLTYEGLIDDVLGIQVGGCVSVKKSVVEHEDDGGRAGEDPTVLIPLNDSDPLYAAVRDRHVEIFGTFLQEQAKALKESHSQFTDRETARDLNEIHQFVKQIPVFTRNLRSLTNHIHIAELVKSAAETSEFRNRWMTERSMLESEACYEALEDLIASGMPPFRWLRLFCLQSLTSNGIKAARYDSLRREVVQTYGYEFLGVLHDLERAGFLRKRETFFMDSMATPYSTLRKALELIVPDVDPSDPGDASYVSSGYAPMTVRWIKAAMGGYAGLEEAMKELPVTGASGSGGGRYVDVEQRSPPESLVEAMRRGRGPSLGKVAKKWAENGDASETQKKPVLLVYFVGGVTFMELAALRFLSGRSSFPYEIVCCCTEIVNGGTLLRSLSC